MRTLLLAVLFALTLQGTRVTFTTIASGDTSQVEERRTVVVRTTKEWAALWREHAGATKAPAVDFDKDMVVAVFAGSRPTAGHTVEFDSMEPKGATLIVRYRVRGPKADEMVAQVLTAPFHIVRTAATASTVSFTELR